LSSADFGKGEVSLINVWASWCTPCAEEQPELVALQKQGIPIFGIDYKDTTEKARRFLVRFGNPYRAIGADTSGLTGLDFGVSGVPETFVIGADGRVVYRYPGPLTPQIVQDAILPAIERARAMAPKADATANREMMPA
jgi:cytochrome c biogenesis protein CcmG/thiol:disulfide interchange protein DsbE